jgi:hypothetical protein
MPLGSGIVCGCGCSLDVGITSWLGIVVIVSVGGCVKILSYDSEYCHRAEGMSIVFPTFVWHPMGLNTVVELGMTGVAA